MCLRMVMTSMPTIQQALRPLSVTCFIVGLNVYPFNGSRSRIGWSEYLSLLYCLTVWFVYGYILYYVVIFFSLISLLPYDMLYTMLVNIPITITSVIVNIYHDKVNIKYQAKDILAQACHVQYTLSKCFSLSPAYI